MKTERHIFKRLLLFLVILLCVTCMSCTDDSKGDNLTVFRFTCEMVDAPIEYHRGERFAIKISVSNVSDQTYVCECLNANVAFETCVKLFCEMDGKEYSFSHDGDFPDCMPTKYDFLAGKTDTATLYGSIPDDAPAGVYSVRLSYGDDYQIFHDVLTVVE